MDLEEYMNKANKQLKDENFYKKLNQNPTGRCQQHHKKF